MAFVVKFKNRNIEPVVKAFDASRKLITTYDLEYNDKHQVIVVKTGEVNVYDKIQTYAHDNDFSRILRNIELTQDINLYAPKQKGFVDATQFAQDKTEALKQAIEVEYMTSKLKNDEYVKSKGIPFDEFIKTYNSIDHLNWLKAKYEKKEVKDE